MAALLARDEVVAASRVVQATPDELWALISDVTRIPEWSPECFSCRWIGPDRFRGWNRRRFGVWTTTARVVESEPGRVFSFVVQAMGGDFTQWSYRLTPEPGGATQLAEEVRMCIDLPRGAAIFERTLMRVRDRRTDLEDNLRESLRRIAEVVESEEPIG